MAHLTCQGHTRDEIADDPRRLPRRPASRTSSPSAATRRPTRRRPAPSDYTYAIDLIDDIDRSDHFSIGVAAHPEVHPRSPDRATDRRHLAAKLRRADFAITQFFFEAEHYAASGRRARRARRRQAGDPRDHADHERRAGRPDGGAERRRGAGVARRAARAASTTPPRCAGSASTIATDAVRRAARSRRAGPALLHAEPQHGDPRDLRQPRARRGAEAIDDVRRPGLHAATPLTTGGRPPGPERSVEPCPVPAGPRRDARARRRGGDGVPRQHWLPGGFLGVEVFFVISGYLITLLLIGEHERTGRVSLRQFWLRRARRLLPGAVRDADRC